MTNRHTRRAANAITRQGTSRWTPEQVQGFAAAHAALTGFCEASPALADAVDSLGRLAAARPEDAELIAVAAAVSDALEVAMRQISAGLRPHLDAVGRGRAA